jgi:hypothetical protein
MSIAKDKAGLGFRELRSLNNAMLGEEAWRLLDNPMSALVF